MYSQKARGSTESPCPPFIGSMSAVLLVEVVGEDVAGICMKLQLSRPLVPPGDRNDFWDEQPEAFSR